MEYENCRLCPRLSFFCLFATLADNENWRKWRMRPFFSCSPQLTQGVQTFQVGQKDKEATQHTAYSCLCFCWLRNNMSKCPMLNNSQYFNCLLITFLVNWTKKAVFIIISTHFTVAQWGLSFVGLGIMGASNKLTRKPPQLSLEFVPFLQKIHPSFIIVLNVMLIFGSFHLLDHIKPTAERKNFIYLVTETLQYISYSS